jgi:hypothetical protein
MLLPLLLLAVLHSAGANAQTGQTLRVEPALIQANVAPGESETVTLTVKADESMKIDVSPKGLGQNTDGGFQILAEDQDASAYSGRPFVKATPTSFTLDPGETREVRVTINVPKEAGEGGRYAILEVKGRPGGMDDDVNVGIGATIGASVVVTLEGTTQTRTGDITAVNVAPVEAGSPINVQTSLQNTGNYHYGATPIRMYAAATLKDPAGNSVVTTVTPLTETSLVPTYARDFAIDLAATGELAAGRYAVEVQFGLEDGTILDKSTVDVNIGAPVVLQSDAAPGGGDGGNGMLYIVAALIVAALVLAGLAFLAARRRRGEQTEG